jgi:hypothetical protein
MHGVLASVPNMKCMVHGHLWLLLCVATAWREATDHASNT